MKVLVTGATGAIGPRVVYALNQAGHKIHTFSMDSPTAGTFPPDVEAVVGDVTDEAAVESAMQGVDAVVHMAALLHIVNPSSELRGKYARINVGGTATVVEAAIKAGVRRVVFFSTIAVYGQAAGRVIDERTPAKPLTFYAQTKLAAEQIVLNAKNVDGHHLCTVLRLGAVYGSRIKGNYERLTHALARNRFIPIGNGLNRRTLVYDKDVGHATVSAVSHPSAEGKIFNVTDGTFHTLKDIIESICSALGRQPPQLSLPYGIVRLLAGVIEGGYHIFGLRAPITPEMVYKYTEDTAVSGDLIQKELGFLPQYDLQAGWHEAISEMRHMGYL